MDKKSRNRHVVVPADMKRYDRQLHRLNFITKELVKFVNDKDVQYGSSWRKRGGAGAFMVIARKWDRIEQVCETRHPAKYDIFDVFEADDRSETILDDCLDLVGYLLILIEHMVEIGHITEIESLRMKFDLSPREVLDLLVADRIGRMGQVDPQEEAEVVATGMQKPFGFDEKEDVPSDAEIEAQADSIPGPEGEE